MPRYVRWFLILLASALLLWLLWYLRTVLGYVLIAAVLALIGRPIMKLLEKVRVRGRALPVSVSAVLTVTVLFGVVLGLLSLFIPLVAQEARFIASIDVNAVAASLEEPMAELDAWMAQYNMSLSHGELSGAYARERLASVLDVTKVSNVFSALIGALGNVFIALFSIVFITFFFLKDHTMLRQVVLALTPKRFHEQTTGVMDNARQTLTRYFVGILTQITVITILVTIGLSILGVKNALLIGFFAGVINVIPYIGPLIGASFGIVIALTSGLEMDFYSEMLPLAGYILLVFLTVQLLDNFILQPIIFSNSVNVHPLEIFLVIMAAGTLAGVAGMIVAVPVYSFLRIIARAYFSEFRAVQELTRSMDD
ncbi:MAG: AI-2E family transporter [Bacteroidota bacterium]